MTSEPIPPIIGKKYIFLVYGLRFLGKLLGYDYWEVDSDKSSIQYVMLDDLKRTKVWLPINITVLQEHKEHPKKLSEDVI